MRREQGLRERPFGGFEELQKGRGEPGGLNTKERLSKGEGPGQPLQKRLDPGCGARRMQRIYLGPTLLRPSPTKKAAVRTPAMLLTLGPG